MVSQLADRAKSVVRDLDPTNSLTFLRVKSAKHEVKLKSNLISASR
jgi:dynein light chain roadblock-type